MINVQTNKLLLNVAEAAAALGIGRTLCYDLVLRGELRSVKVGRCRRIPASAVEEYVRRLEAEGVRAS